MRILISHKDIGEPTRGGVCELYKNLILGLAEKGIEVVYVTTKDTWIENKLIRRVLLPRGVDPETYAKYVSDVIRKENPDIAECSNWRFELLDFATRRDPNGKTKVIVRTDPSAKTLFPEIDISYHNGEKKLLKAADYIIAVSNYTASDIEKRYPVKIDKVIYNGVNHSQIDKMIFKNKGSRQKICKQVFWIGRPNFMKGIDVLESVIKKTDKSWTFVLNYGQSPDNIKIQTIHEEHQNTKLVKDLPKHEQIKLIYNSHYFLSTSRHEGFGIAVLEALACSVPVLAFNKCQVLKELYPNTNAVKFFDESDIGNIKLFDENIDVTIGKSARQTSLKYSVERMVDKTIKFYKEITN